MTDSGLPSLRSFLRQIEAEDQVLAVTREVSCAHELFAVVKALERRGNPIVRFDRVKESLLPVIVGVTGTRERIAVALGRPVSDCIEYLLDRIEHPIPVQRVSAAPAQEVIEEGAAASLRSLPIGIHSPEDAAPYITVGVLLIRDPATGTVNSGIYRTMVKDAHHLTLNSAPQHDLARILSAAGERGETVDFAIVIGGHPTLAIASQAKNPTTVDALELAGALQGEALSTVPGITVDLDIPAAAEVVIEGRVAPAPREAEGPFGEFTYYYGAAAGWVGEVTAITRRSDALWVDLHPSHVEHRCLWLFPGREARLLDLLRHNIAGVKTVHLPFYGAALSAYISLSKQHDGDVRRALLLALSSDTYIKHAFVFDTDVDIFDPEHVLWALNVRFQADRDMVIVPRSRGVRMDPSSYDFLDRSHPGLLTTDAGFDVTMPTDWPHGPRADIPAPGYERLDLGAYVPGLAR